MNHDDVAARLSEYLEGELPLRQRALVDAHLDGCPSCREALLDLRAAVDVLRELAEVEPQGRIADAVMARIRAGEAQPSLWGRLIEAIEILTAPRIVRPVALAAACAVILVAARPEVGEFLVRALASSPIEPGRTATDQSAEPRQTESTVASSETLHGPRPIGSSSADATPVRVVVRPGGWSGGFGLPHTIELSRNPDSRHVHPILIATPIVPVSRPPAGLQRRELGMPAYGPLPDRAPSPVIQATPVSVPFDGAR